MTNDESEIERRVHSCVICPAAHGTGEHSYDCNRVTVMLRTALAAEREQHARDVAEAEARTWREAAKVAGNAILDRRNDISDFGLGVKHSARLLFSECKRKGEAMACAQALNDSPRAVADRKDGRKPDHPQVQGSANRRLDSADGGINQGSGAGDCGDCLSLPSCHAAAPPPSPASPTGTPHSEGISRVVKLSDTATVTFRSNKVVIAGGRYQSDDDVELTPEEFHALLTSCAVAPASPTGETRDEPGSAYCDDHSGDPACGWSGDASQLRREQGRNGESLRCPRCGSSAVIVNEQPASAPGGAPGMETCGLACAIPGCDGRCVRPAWSTTRSHDVCTCAAHVCPGCGGVSSGAAPHRHGTTPTPSTDPPTCGRPCAAGDGYACRLPPGHDAGAQCDCGLFGAEPTTGRR